ncbi:MAG: acetyl ornithine aminotransferase family protein [Euryarchaeota archaeon]|nr:acetyl ornithine aminotransferase family protein [Euryarchaeota archaeon]
MNVPHIKVAPPGPRARKVLARDKKWLATATKTSPLVVDRASGSLVEDVDGNVYIDFTCGVSVANIGHAHPAVTEAIREQAERFTHFAGTDFYYDVQVRLAERLAALAPGNRRKKVFFSNSGAEAIETAIKIAKWKTGKHVFLAFLNAFHGRTMGALSLTASKAVQRARFHPMMPGTVHVPYAYCYRCPYKLTYPSCDVYCADIIEDLYMKTVAPPEDLAAVFFEPIQGEGGYVVPPPGWVERIQRIAHDHGALLIADEVQTGMGRTGKWFAIEHTKAVPDVIAMAKALGSGIPIGATIFDASLDFGERGAHSNTFGGNPVACAAALATLDVIERERLLERATRLGEHMHRRLEEMRGKYEVMGDNRGRGLMRATEFVSDQGSRKPAPNVRDAIVQDALKRGLILLPAGTAAIRYIPALNIPEEFLDKGLDILEAAIRRAV